MADSEVKNDEPAEEVPPAIKYPIEVKYCGVCTMPIEYCEYSGMADKCLLWLQNNMTDEFERIGLSGAMNTGDIEKKHQKRGGKGSKVPVEKGVDKNSVAKVTLQRAARGKNKSVTVIRGLASFNVDLKAAAKMFAGRFACGSSVTAPNEIVVQGDVKDDLIDIITSKWSQIPPSSIEDLGDQKR